MVNRQITIRLSPRLWRSLERHRAELFVKRDSFVSVQSAMVDLLKVAFEKLGYSKEDLTLQK